MPEEIVEYVFKKNKYKLINSKIQLLYVDCRRVQTPHLVGHRKRLWSVFI